MRLAGLADRIREFLKSGSGEAETIEIGPWMENFMDRYGVGQGDRETPVGDESPRLALDSELGNLRVRIDPARLTQALDNLVANAVEALAGLPEAEIPLIHARRRGNSLALSVLDRGGGVAPHDRERIFEPFFTTKEKGSGIGLALARKVARSAGGDILYEDRQGGGACFTLLLPGSP
jgi:signal transduction histidine kinase